MYVGGNLASENEQDLFVESGTSAVLHSPPRLAISIRLLTMLYVRNH